MKAQKLRDLSGINPVETYYIPYGHSQREIEQVINKAVGNSKAQLYIENKIQQKKMGPGYQDPEYGIGNKIISILKYRIQTWN